MFFFQPRYMVANSIDRVQRPVVSEIRGPLPSAKVTNHTTNLTPKIISHVSMTPTPPHSSTRILRNRKSARKCPPVGTIRLSAHDAIRSRRTAKKRKASLSSPRHSMVRERAKAAANAVATASRESRDRNAKAEASQKIISTSTAALPTGSAAVDGPPMKKERRGSTAPRRSTIDSSVDSQTGGHSQSSNSHENRNPYEFDDSDATATGLRPEDDLINKRRLEHIPPKQRWRKEEELRRIQDERSRVFGERLGLNDGLPQSPSSVQRGAANCVSPQKGDKSHSEANDSHKESSSADGKISLKIKINRSPTKAGYYRCQIVDKSQNRATGREADATSPPSSEASSTEASGHRNSSVFRSEQPSTSTSQDQSHSPCQFTPGDVVWGKILGWPWWPCVIKRIVNARQGSSEGTAEVQWLNWDQVSFIPVDKIVPFVQCFNSKYDRRKAKRRAYKSAVDEALRLAKARCNRANVPCNLPDQNSSALTASDATSSVSSSHVDSGGHYCSLSNTFPAASNGIGTDTVNSCASAADLASADRAFDSALQSFTLAAAEHDGLAPPDPLTPLPDLGPSLSRAEEWCEIARVTLPTFSDDDDEDFNAKLALDPASIDRIQAT